MGQLPFSRQDPIPWRVIDAGLCLEGRCVASQNHCLAHQKMVIGNLQTGQVIISSMHSFRCPTCGQEVRADRFGLNRCRWRLLNSNRWYKVGKIYESYGLNHRPIRMEILPPESEDKPNGTEEAPEDCTICLAAMNEKHQCSILPCQHIFHMACIHQWIDADEDNSLLCPVCRHPIFE